MKSFYPPQKQLQAWGLITLCIILIYLPLIWSLYGFSDDYAVLWQMSNGKADIFQLVFAAGRPINAIILQAVFGQLKYISQLGWLRLFTILTTCIFAIYFYNQLIKQKIDGKIAVLFSIAICTIPSMQVYLSWANYFLNPIGLLLSCIASSILVSFNDENVLSEHKNYPLALIAACALQLAAMLIHQSLGMFFWVLLAVDLILGNHPIKSSFKRLLLAGGVWGSSVLGAYLAVKIGSSFYPILFGRNSLIHIADIQTKVYWFFTKVVSRSLNFYNLNKENSAAVLFGLVILGGLWLTFHEPMKDRVVRWFLALSLIPLTYLPNLIVQENWGSYRTQVAITSLLVIYFLIAVKAWVNKIPIDPIKKPQITLILTTIFTLYGMVSASYNTSISFAQVQSLDLAYMRSQLSQTDFSKISQIQIVRSNWSDSKVSAYFDEFGMPSSYTYWSPEPMARLILREIAPEYQMIPITVFEPRTQLTSTDGYLNLYMENIQNFR